MIDLDEIVFTQGQQSFTLREVIVTGYIALFGQQIGAAEVAFIESELGQKARARELRRLSPEARAAVEVLADKDAKRAAEASAKDATGP
jgi:hypothetical protein